MATPYSRISPITVEFERRIQDLETMARWRDELAERIRRV